MNSYSYRILKSSSFYDKPVSVKTIEIFVASLKELGKVANHPV